MENNYFVEQLENGPLESNMGDSSVGFASDFASGIQFRSRRIRQQALVS